MYWMGSFANFIAHVLTHVASHAHSHTIQRIIISMVQTSFNEVKTDSSVKSKRYICADNGREWCRLHVLSAPLRRGN